MRKFLFFVVLILSAVLQDVVAQTKTVTGKVSDQQNGLGLPGVSVIVKGTSVGTATTADGTYTLNVPADGTTLIFRFIGYVPVERAIGNQGTINVTMAVDEKQLDEVVIVAYGTADKNSFTGSAAQITPEKIAQRPVTNIVSAISGQAAGVQTSGNSGQPGSGVAIRIRGFGSFSSSNEPLYVVDGVPYAGSIANLNSDDVENISILKDAASTSLYGARASNGVVIITTKKGKANRSEINFKVTQGYSTRGLEEYDRVNAFEYYPLVWEAYRNSLVATGSAVDAANLKASNDVHGILKYNPFNVPNKEIVTTDGKINPNAKLLYGDDLDWANELTRTGNRKDYGLSFSGGADKTDYFVSLGYLNDKGYLIKSDYERFTGRVNVNNQATSWLKTGLNLSGTMTESNQANDASSTGYVNPFYFSRNIGPIYPVYQHDPVTGAYILDEKGNKIYDLGVGRGPGASAGRHVLAETVLNNNLFNRAAVGGRTYGEIKFLKDFKFTTNLSVDVSNYTGLTFENTLVGDGAPAGRASNANSTTTSYTVNQLLNYSKTFGQHYFDALLGHENYDYTYKYSGGSKQGIIVDGITELVNFTTINSLTSYTDKYRTEGYFGRLNYTFADKYTLSGSYRKDGSSRFYKDVRWGDFWSVGASWRVDRESFIRMPEWMDMLKVRASYGEVGNDDIGNYYAWQALYSFGPGFNNASEPGFLQSSLASEDLLWESSNSYDFGVDFSVLNNRIHGSAEYFYRGSDNLLFEVPLPLSSGVLTRFQNIGALFNKGVELQVSADVVKAGDFTWNIDANWTTLKNEFTKLPDTQKEILNGTKKIMVGRSLYDFWLRDFYGVNPDNGDALYRANVYSDGDAKIKIINGDTLTNDIANAKYHYAGTAIPDFTGGITNTLSYKGLSLSALVTYQVGGQIYDGTYASLMTAYNEGGAWHKDIQNRWQKPGDITDVPKIQAGTQSASLSSGTSDRWLTDASFFNLRSVTLAYNLPESISSKVYAKRANVYVTGENLTLGSARKGMNVGQNFSGTTSNVYTPAKIVTFGLNVTL
jgi:TonB-linked SusC/RagA family outer membrane protein